MLKQKKNNIFRNVPVLVPPMSDKFCKIGLIRLAIVLIWSAIRLPATCRPSQRYFSGILTSFLSALKLVDIGHIAAARNYRVPPKNRRGMSFESFRCWGWQFPPNGAVRGWEKADRSVFIACVAAASQAGGDTNIGPHASQSHPSSVRQKRVQTRCWVIQKVGIKRQDCKKKNYWTYWLCCSVAGVGWMMN